MFYLIFLHDEGRIRICTNNGARLDPGGPNTYGSGFGIKKVGVFETGSTFELFRIPVLVWEALLFSPLCVWRFHITGNALFGFERCCGSGMFVPDPDFYPSRIPDPGARISDLEKQKSKREGWKKICCHIFFFSHKYHKIENYFTFWTGEENNLGQFTKNYRTFTQKIVICLSKIWDPKSGTRDPKFGNRDPGSGKNLFRIPDPGVKKAPDLGSGYATVFTHGASDDEFQICRYPPPPPPAAPPTTPIVKATFL